MNSNFFDDPDTYEGNLVFKQQNNNFFSELRWNGYK